MAKTLTKVGRYQIVSELGRGSMGVVYQGFDPVIGRTVAIKTMLTEGLGPAEFEEFKARFQREAQAAGLLSHPNILTVYDFGEDGGVLYLVMEFLEGKSVQQIVSAQNVLPIETIIPMYEQVCSALDLAHSHKIVHRDIKPANIMILESGLVKVTDFGIAKMMSMGMTQAGQILGTPNYMSPEQVKGGAVDGRSDIFALGVILYELVTGEKPFGGQNITTVIYKIINENPIPPRELDPTVHPGLSYAISKALAKSPDERYQTCRELADDLRNYRNLGRMEAQPAETIVVKRVPPVQAPPAPAYTPPPATSGHAPAPPRYQQPAALQAYSPPAPPAYEYRPPPTRPGPERVEAPAEQQAGRPLSVTVIPAAQPKPPRSSSAAMWVFLTVLLVGVLGGGAYYFLVFKNPAAPPPTPPPATAHGTLTVDANVSGAKIWIDGQTAPDWTTPHTFTNFAVGSHQVVVTKDGYADASLSVNVGEGGTTPVSAQLNAVTAKGPTPDIKPAQNEKRTEIPAAPGQLVVSANVEGARISVDGQSAPDWTTPHTLPNMKAGAHQVTVSKDGYDSCSQTVIVEEGQSTPIRCQLSQSQPTVATGEVTVVTVPPGGQVTIDGRAVGPSPAHAVLAVGTHTFTATQPGGEPHEGQFEITPGLMLTKTVRWTPSAAVPTGIVEVRSDPPGATVVADGESKGTTPTSFRLAVGRHTLTISMSGYASVQRGVDVPAEGTVPVRVTLSPQ